MRGYEIIELALEFHRSRGGAPVPGKIAEQLYQSLVQKWLGRSAPYRRQIEGNVPSSKMIDLPGYREALLVQKGGDTRLAALSTGVLANDNPSNLTGYVVKDEKLYFLDVDEDTAYKVVYFADHPDLDMEAEPACPEQLHENLAIELSYKFKAFGAVAITAQRMFERRQNRREFGNLMGSRGTDKHRPIQPDPLFQPRS